MEEPFSKRLESVPKPKFTEAAKRFVELAVVLKRLVVVAEVPVA